MSECKFWGAGQTSLSSLFTDVSQMSSITPATEEGFKQYLLNVVEGLMKKQMNTKRIALEHMKRRSSHFY